jgi:MATE family multidrug resistance protein
VIVTWLMLGVALLLVRFQPLYAPYRLWQRPEAPNATILGGYLSMGVPAGLSIMIEVTSFTLMALFVARMGTSVAASHQIATNVAAVLYMVPLSLGIATSARVGFWLGRQQHRAARNALLVGLSMATVLGLLLSTAVWLGKEALAQAYSPHPDVVALAIALLPWVAGYHLFDAVQAVTVFALRCFRITVLPMLVYGVVLWGVGLGGGYAAAYTVATEPAHSAVPFWQYSAVALAITALIMLVLLFRAVRPTTGAHARGESTP